MTQGKGNRGKLGTWIAVLAIVASILYVMYVLKWSGSELAAFELAASGGEPTHTVELEAGMSPMRALIETELFARNGRAFAYDVTIHGQDMDGVKEVLVKNADMYIRKKKDSDSSNRRRKQSANVNLGTFDVPAGGNYVVRSTIDPYRNVTVREARLVLMANTATFDFRIIGGLVLALLVGLALGKQGDGGRDT